jgi:type II secretory pathway component GspD/PulD (secretin)
MATELEKYVIVLNQRDALFPLEYAFQGVARRDDLVIQRMRQSTEAAEYLRKLAAEGKNVEAREGAETLLRSWTYFMLDNAIYSLAPLPETTEAIFDVARFYAETWDKATEAERQAAREEGKFADYPTKDFIELVLQKQNLDYQEIQRLEMGRLTDESKTFENLEKEIALWTKIVETAPMLKYDSTSDVVFEIQACVRDYLLELKKREQPEPENFPLQAFAEAAE